MSFAAVEARGGAGAGRPDQQGSPGTQRLVKAEAEKLLWYGRLSMTSKQPGVDVDRMTGLLARDPKQMEDI